MYALVDPLAVALVALAGATIWAWLRRQALGACLTLILFALCFLSMGPSADLVLRPLEQAYPPLHIPPARPVAAVVVLTGGEGWTPERPITSALSTSSTDRLVEGIRLWRELDGAVPLLFVGGIGSGAGRAEAPLMAQAARALGVPADALRWEAASRNTFENALAVRELLGDAPFVLVTSAFHMPRAMAVFVHLGLSAVPAPCGHAARLVHSAWDFVPSSQTLWRSAQALREHVALVWYRMRHLRD